MIVSFVINSLQLLTEIKLHKTARHVHIVKFLECFEDDANVYIILELCPNMVREHWG